MIKKSILAAVLVLSSVQAFAGYDECQATAANLAMTAAQKHLGDYNPSRQYTTSQTRLALNGQDAANDRRRLYVATVSVTLGDHTDKFEFQVVTGDQKVNHITMVDVYCKGSIISGLLNGNRIL